MLDQITNSTQQLETTLFYVLLQLIVIIIAARVAGHIARHFGQPRAVGEIVAGLILGPSLFGLLFPEVYHVVFESVPTTSISIISQIGLILLMFQIGMDFDFSHLNDAKNRKSVALISTACIVLPFMFGITIGLISSPELAPGIATLPYALFIGTAMSITAVPILGRIMAEFGLTKTKVGAITISAAAINDVAGWILLAVISSLSVAQYSYTHTIIQFVMLFAYVVICWKLVRPLLCWAIERTSFNDNKIPQNLTAIMLAVIFCSALCTQYIGIFSIFGGFAIGVLVHKHEKFVAAWKQSVGDFVLVFFLPVFFTYTGLRTNLLGLDSANLWTWCAIILVFSTIGKFGGAYFAARTAGLSHQQSGTIGIMMNTRALMALIVLNVGFDLGFIPQDVFTMLVVMAIVTTIITAPVLNRLLPSMGHVIPQKVDA